jgi:uncharacterized protein YdiU (UPF0061 family)
MDAFNPDTVFSSIDHGGRYAYRNQPGIAHWNLACLAQTLLPLLHEVEEQAVVLAQGSIDSFQDLFLDAHQQGMCRKLGFESADEADEVLVQDLLAVMAESGADFTLTFRRLADLANPATPMESSVGDIFELPDIFAPWLARWEQRLARENTSPAERQQQMYRSNPVFIPRNHLVQEVIAAATDGDDFAPFHTLVDRLGQPYTYDPAQSRYALPPRPEQVVRQTFCGT